MLRADGECKPLTDNGVLRVTLTEEHTDQGFTGDWEVSFRGWARCILRGGTNLETASEVPAWFSCIRRIYHVRCGHSPREFFTHDTSSTVSIHYSSNFFAIHVLPTCRLKPNSFRRMAKQRSSLQYQMEKGKKNELGNTVLVKIFSLLILCGQSRRSCFVSDVQMASSFIAVTLL